MQSLIKLLICLALFSIIEAYPFYPSSMSDDNNPRFPQQGVLENIVNEMLRNQSIEQANNNQVRRQIFSRKFW